MIPNNSRIIEIWVFLAAAAMFQAAVARNEGVTGEILSNNMYSCAGHGDTLWISNAKGINTALKITQDTVLWQGYRETAQRSAIAWCNGVVLAFPYDRDKTSMAWFVAEASPDAGTRITFPYRAETFPPWTTGKTAFSFYPVDGVYLHQSIWIAAQDGGIIRMPLPGTAPAAVFQAGRKNPFSFAEYTLAAIAAMPDSTPDLSRRVVALAAHNQKLWVACEQALWTFAPSDSSWRKINDSSVQVLRYDAIACPKENDTAVLYALLSTKPGVTADTLPHLYTYNTVSGRWHRSIGASVAAFRCASNKRLYVVDNQNRIELFRDTLPSDTLVHTPYLSRPLVDEAGFAQRIRNAESTVTGYEVRDLAYSIRGADTILAIATDVGLYYSRNEHADETAQRPFTLAMRTPAVAAGLKKVYAFPSIINEAHPKAVFAYNLSEPDKVTIDIFDYNADHVVRIVESAPRISGSATSGGRSTIPSQDFWDGTMDNKNGRAVAAGVYYFRIATKKGRHATGKIIVAK